MRSSSAEQKVQIELPSYSSSDALQAQGKRDYNTSSPTTTSNQEKSIDTQSDDPKWTFELPSHKITISHPPTQSQSREPNTNTNQSEVHAPEVNLDDKDYAWKYSSTQTNWSLCSQSLLSITYIPAVQAIPEYTRKYLPVDYMQRLGKHTKCLKACCSGWKKQSAHMEIYDGDDIEDVQIFEMKNKIKGYPGTCQAVRIRFRNKSGKKTRCVYTYKKKGESVQAQDQEIPCNGRQVLIDGGYVSDTEHLDDDGIPFPPWHPSVNLNKSETANTLYGPILTFVIPDVSHPEQMESYEGFNKEKPTCTTGPPPLLWKVQLPPDPSIALEAITVFDGALDVHPSDDEDDNSNYNGKCPDPWYNSDDECDATHPTNIYINGWQSWSFTGSVSRRDEQPKSGMPDFLSKAFNFGGDIPPVPSEINGTRRWDTYDVNSFHDLAHYQSDFFTCVSCNEKEDTNMSGDNSKNGKSERNRLDEMGGPAVVLGFISQRKHFGIINFDSDLYRVAMHASAQGVIASKANGVSTDWAYCQILSGECYDEEPMVHYLNAVSSYNSARPLQNFPPLTGWCSWYHYYENIDSKSLCTNFEKLADLKSRITSDAVIIDDGYMTSWGDWSSLKPKGFPESSGGMGALAKNIESHGIIPGLWMAPFACDKNSEIAKKHPDWIIRNNEGRIANSANCGKFFYGLDATNPAVRQFAFDNIQMAVKEWGYRVLKLDFLYAACLPGNGKYDINMTRAETMYLALQTLRAAAGPDTFIIGCGCPIGPAIGYVDANRVSADTGPTWYPDFPLPKWDHGTLPSLRAMVRNSITRIPVGHRFWHNDPDCILLGDTTRLTDTEVISAATVVAMTGGMLLLSDDLSKLSSERLRVATRIYPVTGVTATALDLHNTSESGIPSLMRLWCTDEISVNLNLKSANAIKLASNNAKRTSCSTDKLWLNPWDRKRNCIPVVKGLGSWSIISLSNWLDKSRIVSVPMSAFLPPDHDHSNGLDLGYHVFSFWSSKYIWVSKKHINENRNLSKKLGPHASEIFHVRPVSPHQPQYIGSELHFTCGYEVIKFDRTPTSVDLQLRKDSKRAGFVYLFIPKYSDTMNITMSGMIARGEIVARCPKICHNNSFYGGQVVRVWVVINGNGAKDDGRVTINVN